jgi:hypothetical protein
MARRVIFYPGNPVADYGVYNGKILSCPLCKNFIDLSRVPIDRYGNSKNKVICSICRFEEFIRLGD